MKNLIIQTLILLSLPTLISAQDIFGVKEYHWTPQKDEVFLQEVSKKVFTDTPVLSVAEKDGACYALLSGEIYLLDGENLEKVENSPSGITKLLNKGDELWALSDDGVYQLENKVWEKRDGRKYVDMCMHNGILHAATRDEVFSMKNGKFVTIKPDGGYNTSDMTMMMEDGSQLHGHTIKLGPITKLESYSGTLYILRPGKLVLFDGKVVNKDFIDWGSLPSPNTRDMLSLGNRIVISTDRGLGVLRGAALTTLKGKDGLPVEDTRTLTRGFGDDLWIGTSRGAVRMVNDEFQYFGADIWLPDNSVNDIAVGDNVVYIATDKGLGVINYEEYTLRKKAAFYERHLDEWGHKRLGFIHTLYKKNGEWVREISDNDGGHTSPYLAAMCYKYVVTGDKKAREEAVNSFYAMLWLERITPVDGFFARSIWSPTADKDERGKEGSGGLPAKWYKTPDGKWWWKGDTSSDELIAHFYSVSIFYELVAEGKEKELAREHLRRIASYVIDNNWMLIDMDGKPTRWGRWNPEYLLRPYGYVDRGINGLEALAFTKAAYVLTGDEKFKEGYDQLIAWGYPENTIRQKNVFPPENIATWDDNHAYRSYYTLFRYEEDPILRSIYLRSLERTWEVKRSQHIPWFNFGYGAITGNSCENDRSVKHLREWPLDCIKYSYRNSHRDDLFFEPGYTSYEGGIKVLSPREMCMERASRSAIVLDGGSNGNVVMEPTGFIRDYWMGRYHGFIEAPTTDNPELISVKLRTGQKFGCEPYNGPKRPKIK